MKKITALLMWLLTLLPLVSQETEETEEPVAFTLYTDVVSAYFYRQYNFGNSATVEDNGKDAAFPVAPAIQTGVEASRGDVSILFWNSFSTMPEAADWTNEMDIFASYYMGPVTLSVGTCFYKNAPAIGTKPGDPDQFYYASGTSEFSLNYAWDFGLSLTASTDLGGSYSYYETAYTIPMPEALSGLEITANISSYIYRNGVTPEKQLLLYKEATQGFAGLYAGYTIPAGPGEITLYGKGLYSFSEHGLQGGEEVAQAYAGLGYALPLNPQPAEEVVEE